MCKQKMAQDIDIKQSQQDEGGHMHEHREPVFQYHGDGTPANLFRQLNLLFHLLKDDRAIVIIKMRHGFEDGIAHSLQSIGEHFAITRERVRQIVLKRLQKLPPTTVLYLVEEMSRPFTRILEVNGGVMKEADIARDLPRFALLGTFHPSGVTRFILSFANNVTAIAGRVWALKDLSLAEVEHIRAKGIEIVSGNLTRIPIKDLVSRISASLDTAGNNAAFIEACVRTCDRLHITDENWCLLPKWQNSYIDDAVEILRSEGEPLHCKKITEKINEQLSTMTSISEHSIYNRLLTLKNIFVLTKPRTFGLTEWISPNKQINVPGTIITK